MKAIVLFAGAGICEYDLKENNIQVVAANELTPVRAKVHKAFYPDCHMIIGDIADPKITNEIIAYARENPVDLLIATPPCQGISTAGSNKTDSALLDDPRNSLILYALQIFDSMQCDFFIIENVPRFARMLFPFQGEFLSLHDLLNRKYAKNYSISCDILNAADYGVAQSRSRIVFRLWKKRFRWDLPEKREHITLQQAIGDLPSIEPGDRTDIPNHYARPHPANQIECMRYTPTGSSAFFNAEHFPKKTDGTRVTGYKNTYKRMRWDAPAPTITMRNEIISSQENVHPGRPLGDGTWSDARVLTLRELLIVSSLPPDLKVPEGISETMFRQLIGEGVPPLMFAKILQGIHADVEKRCKGLSLFAGGGIAETYFEETGIDIVVANELLPKRAAFYRHTHPKTDMVCGDITDPSVFDQVMQKAKAANVTFLLATPPCQGMSTLGKREYVTDQRNSLVHYVLSAIDLLSPEYVLIENVPKFAELYFNERGDVAPGTSEDKGGLRIDELLKKRYADEYCVEMRILNAMHYGVPQSRPRAIIKVYRKGLKWSWPAEDEHVITLREAIGDLPSLESGEKSNLKWHNALVHNARQVLALQHTPEGQSAMKNPVYYPKKADGSRVKGFHNTYNRMRWDEPAPARTTNNHLMSGHNNVHPGRLRADGTWSDARVLTLRELIIVSSLPLDWNIPEDVKEPDLREIIGEAIPPLLSKKIVETIGV